MLTQTITIKLHKPHPAQAAIRKDKRRFNVISCGRRFGKTDLFVGLISETALGGFPVGYFAPRYKLVIETWAALVRCLGGVIKSRNFTEKRIELITGGVIEMWTMDDPDAGRSRKYKRVVIDEAGLQGDLSTIWAESIRPTLMDYGGDAFIGGTPKGANDFYKMYVRADSDPDWKSFRYSTHANPYIPEKEIEDYKTEMGGAESSQYRQEIMAEFVEGSESFFGNIGRFFTAPLNPVRDLLHRHVAGIDWGQSADWTWCRIGCVDTGKHVATYRINRIDYKDIINAIVDLLEAWGVDLVIPEKNSMSMQVGALRDEIERRVLACQVQPFVTTNESKRKAIMSLHAALNSGALELMPDQVARAEYAAFESHQNANGAYMYGAPVGLHDDCVIADMLMWRAMNAAPIGVY